jgi:DNA-binding transcriptional regulator YbjK
MTKVATASEPVQSRSIQRRHEIVEAALRLFAREGAGAVTHRAVATEAGVPLAATTYYFASKSDLLVDAFRLHSQRETARIQDKLAALTAGADSPIKLANRLADFVIEGVTSHREQLIAEYQLLVEGARNDELGSLSRLWLDSFRAAVAVSLAGIGSRRPTVDARIVLATIAGLEVDHLEAPPDAVEQRAIRNALRRLVCALVDGGTAR